MKICLECEFPLDENDDFYPKKGVCKFCYRTEKPAGRQPALNEQESKKAIELYRGGLSTAAVGKRLGCSSSAINRLLIRMNEPIRKDSQHQKVLTNPFETIDTKEKEYWLGFLTTNGSVYGSRVQVTLSSKNIAHLQKWCVFVGLDPETNIKIRSKKGTPMATVVFRSKKVAASLSLRRRGL